MTRLKNSWDLRIPDKGVTEELVTFADSFMLQKIPHGTVLDLGCGRGIFTEKVAEKAALVTGIDIGAEEIACANRYHHRGNTRYVCFNAEDLSKLKGQFDMVISRFCFHHLDMDKSVAGIKARIKKEGRLLVVDCIDKFWTLSGRMFVVKTAIKELGLLRFISISPRLLYFFLPKRFAHVINDKKRLKKQRRYRFEDFAGFYAAYFPGAEIGRVGCAAYIDWKKPTDL
jgi:SAM-dependent methyltransferase